MPASCQVELRRALSLVAMSGWEATLTELADFAVTSADMTSISQLQQQRFSRPEDLLFVSESLFVVSDHRVLLSHQTIREYLSSEPIRQGRAATFCMEEGVIGPAIVSTCLAYLGLSTPIDMHKTKGSSDTHRGLKYDLTHLVLLSRGSAVVVIWR